MKSKEEIKNIITDYLLKDQNIIFAYIFGSFVEDDNFNDIDLSIYSNAEKFDTISLAVKLERLVNIPFDVIDIKTAADHLIYCISKGEVIVNKDDDLRIDFITVAWSRYFDFKYYRDHFLKELSYNE